MSAPAEPRPPKDPPPLDLRAKPPGAVRLRPAAARGAALGAALLLSAALAWAFVVQPELRARDTGAGQREPQGHEARAPELVAAQPASYDRLPEPRRLFGGQDAARTGAEPAGSARAPRPPPAARGPTTAPRPGPAQLAAASGLFFEDAGAGEAGRPAPAAKLHPDYAAAYARHALLPPLSPFELKAGAVIPAALLTAVDTERPGPVTAAVTEDVYDSVSGRHLLLPQGSRLIGRQEGKSAYGERRAAIAWTRLILPNGKSLLLDEEPAVDAQGAAGVRGQVDRRLLPLLAATLFSGAITTLGQMARDRDDNSGGFFGDAGDAASVEAARVGGRLVERELQVRPAIRLGPGTPVRVLITRDLVLEPYRP